MRLQTVTPLAVNYLLNCMLLLLPIMTWNIIFSCKLPKLYSPEIFSKNIPPFIVTGENFFRLIIFIAPILMPIRLETSGQKIGLLFYVAGTTIYFISWLIQIYFPYSTWSLSVWGFLAPAYTPLIWLIGIGLIGDTLYFSLPYRSWMYIVMSVIFLGFHLFHALTVYMRDLQ
jgi:hypothetical protein